MMNEIEVAAQKRRWAAEAQKRLSDNIAAVLRGVNDHAADEAYRALVARLAELQGGRK